MLLTFHLPRGHGTYLKANETYRYFSLLIASDEFLRIHFLRLESQSDLRQRYFQKSYLNDRRQKAQTRHISLYDENSARFRRNDCKGRGSRFYGRTGYCQQEFQCSVRTQSARRPRVGHRCCHRCHYQARIQVLSNRFSAGRERKRLILKENNDYNSTVSTMKRTLFIYTIFLLAISCHKNDDTDNANEPTIYYVKYEASGNGSYSYVDKTRQSLRRGMAIEHLQERPEAGPRLSVPYPKDSAPKLQPADAGVSLASQFMFAEGKNRSLSSRQETARPLIPLISDTPVACICFPNSSERQGGTSPTGPIQPSGIQIPAPALLGNLSGLIGAPNTSYTGVIQSFSFRHALSDGAPYCLAPNIALPMRTIVLPHSTARR